MAGIGINPVPIGLLLLISMALVGRRLLNAIREHRAANWATADGSVTTTNVKVIRADHNELALAELGYSYRVDGEYYSGYYKRQFVDEQEAWTFADESQGKPVLVRYRPRKPQVSVLRVADQPVRFNRQSILGSFFSKAL